MTWTKKLPNAVDELEVALAASEAARLEAEARAELAEEMVSWWQYICEQPSEATAVLRAVDTWLDSDIENSAEALERIEDTGNALRAARVTRGQPTEEPK